MIAAVAALDDPTAEIVCLTLKVFPLSTHVAFPLYDLDRKINEIRMRDETIPDETYEGLTAGDCEFQGGTDCCRIAVLDNGAWAGCEEPY